MPDPTHGFSTDRFFYNNLYTTSDAMCVIHPNVFTIIGWSLVVPLVNNIYNDGPMDTAIVLMFIKQLLDMMDGAQARKCNKRSTLGAFLDTLADSTSGIALQSVILYKIATSNVNNYVKYFSGLFILTWCYFLLKYIRDDYNRLYIKNNKVSDEIHGEVPIFYHDNTLVCGIILIIIAKYIIGKLPK